MIYADLFLGEKCYTFRVCCNMSQPPVRGRQLCISRVWKLAVINVVWWYRWAFQAESFKQFLQCRLTLVHLSAKPQLRRRYFALSNPGLWMYRRGRGRAGFGGCA